MQTTLLPPEPGVYRFILDGNPIPYQAYRTHNGRTYDPQSEVKKQLKYELQFQCNTNPIDQAVKIDVIYYLAIPQAKLKKFLKLPDTIYYQSHKPDIDNLTKMLLDICKGIIIYDDNLVARLNAAKIYSTKPRTEFTITIIGADYANL